MQDDDIIEIGRYSWRYPSKKTIKYVVIGIIVLIVLVQIFFTIQPEELGVIQRFGRHVRTVEPGLNFKIPFGIERLTKVKVLTVFKEEFGFRTLSSGVNARYSPLSFENESLMLTGDLNIASVEWIVQYQIKDPVAYLFRVRNVSETIRNLSESAMRQIVGDRSIDEVIILSRQEIAFAMQELLQQQLDKYDTGISVKTVNLQNVVPPEVVQPAFNDVNSAMQEEERIVNEARQEYNRVIPSARGKARQTIEEANGYAINRINQAKGDADKFISIYRTYANARNVTRQRLYLETMEEIMNSVEKVYIIDENQKNIIPFLEMGSRSRP